MAQQEKTVEGVENADVHARKGQQMADARLRIEVFGGVVQAAAVAQRDGGHDGQAAPFEVAGKLLRKAFAQAQRLHFQPLQQRQGVQQAAGCGGRGFLPEAGGAEARSADAVVAQVGAIVELARVAVAPWRGQPGAEEEGIARRETVAPHERETYGAAVGRAAHDAHVGHRGPGRVARGRHDNALGVGRGVGPCAGGGVACRHEKACPRAAERQVQAGHVEQAVKGALVAPVADDGRGSRYQGGPKEGPCGRGEVGIAHLADEDARGKGHQQAQERVGVEKFLVWP